MAALMRDCLAETVENALRGALQWKRIQSGNKAHDEKQSTPLISSVRQSLAEPPSTQVTVGSDRTYRDNGSNLRIVCPAGGAGNINVQLLKFLSVDTPIKAVLSDGTTRINVKFSNAAVAAYSALKGKSFTQDTRGGVLALRAFEVVVSRIEVSEEEQITLLIKDFLFGGLGGSSTWYQPEAIERRVSVRDILRELQQSWTSFHDDASNQHKGTEENSALNQDDGGSETVPKEGRSADQPHSTQYMTQFASQAGAFRPSSRVSDVSLAGGTNLGRPTEPRRNIIPQQAGPSESFRSGNQLLKMLENISKSTAAQPAKSIANSNLSPSIISQTRSDRANTASIKTEHNKVVHAGSPGQQSMSGAATAPIEISDSSGEEEVATSTPLRQPSTGVSKSTEDPATMEDGNQVSPIGQQPELHQSSTALSASALSVVSENETNHANSCGLTDTILAAIESSGSRKVNGIDADSVLPAISDKAPGLAGSPEVSNPKRQSHPRPTSVVRLSAEVSKTGSSFLHEANFNFTSRLAAAYPVTLEQMKLLNLRESWQHPEPGLRFPCPNIPIETLKELNAAVEHRDRSNISSPVGSHHKVESSSSIPAADQLRDASEVDYIEGGRRLSGQSMISRQSAGSEGYSWASSPPQPPPRRQLEDSLPPGSSADMPLSNLTERFESMPLKDRHLSNVTPDQSPESANDTSRFGHGVNASADLPDESSDLEMAEPQALPSRSTNKDTLRGRNGPNLAPTQFPARKWQGPSFEPLSSQKSDTIRKTDVKPFYPSTNSTSAKTLPSSEPVIPGTFPSDHLESYSRSRAIPTIDGILDSDPPDHVSATLIEQQLEHEMGSASHRHVQHDSTAQLYGESTDSKVARDGSSAEHPVKRKAEQITTSPGHAGGNKRVRRYSLGLDHPSQVTEDPATVVRNAKREFIRNNAQHDESLRARQLGTDRPIRTTTPSLSSDNVRMYDAVENISPAAGDQTTIAGKELTWPGINERQTTLRARGSPTENARRQRSATQQVSDVQSKSDSSRKSTLPVISQVIADPKFESSARIAPRTSNSQGVREDHRPGNSHEVFKAFKSTYPAYTGDPKHFLGLCRKIKNLSESNRPLHRSLWDDYIVRHKTDYIKYALKCTEEGEEAATYERYYHDEIESPLYLARIIDPTTLRSALSEGDPSTAKPISVQSKDVGNNTSRRESSHTAFSRSLSRSSSIGHPHVPSRRESPGGLSPPHSGRESQVSSSRANQGRDSYRPAYNQPSRRRLEDTRIDIAPSSHEQAPAETQRSRRSLPWSTQPRTSKQSLSPVTSLKTLQPERVAHGPKATDIPNPATAGTDDRISTTAQAPSSRSARLDISSPARSTGMLLTGGLTTKEMQSSQMPWWTNDDTPFKDFTRQYARLKIHNGALGSPAENSILNQEHKRLSVLDWHL